MSPLQIAQNTILRKAGYCLFGWCATKWYNSAFGLNWQRELSSHEKIHTDWRSIIRAGRVDQSTDIFISAGDLWSMGPFLITAKQDRACRNRIGNIFIRHLSRPLLQHLTDPNTGLPPLISPSLLDDLDSNLNDLRREYGNNRVFVEPWPAFPRFHGVIYQSYLSYCPWTCDHHGMMTHKTDVRFIHREHDQELFDSYKQSITSGFPN